MLSVVMLILLLMLSHYLSGHLQSHLASDLCSITVASAVGGGGGGEGGGSDHCRKSIGQERNPEKTEASRGGWKQPSHGMSRPRDKRSTELFLTPCTLNLTQL